MAIQVHYKKNTYTHTNNTNSNSASGRFIFHLCVGVMSIVFEEITDVPLVDFYISIMYIKKRPKENLDKNTRYSP